MEKDYADEFSISRFMRGFLEVASIYCEKPARQIISLSFW